MGSSNCAIDIFRASCVNGSNLRFGSEMLQVSGPSDRSRPGQKYSRWVNRGDSTTITLYKFIVDEQACWLGVLVPIGGSDLHRETGHCEGRRACNAGGVWPAYKKRESRSRFLSSERRAVNKQLSLCMMVIRRSSSYSKHCSNGAPIGTRTTPHMRDQDAAMQFLSRCEAGRYVVEQPVR